MNSVQGHLEVQAHLLPTEFGGRMTPISSGFRVQFYYDTSEGDVELVSLNQDSVKPGENFNASLKFIFPANHCVMIKLGMIFLLREGHKVIGYGQVTKIIA